jgi:hypothetical protein
MAPQRPKAKRRDALSMGFEAHRGLLLLRLRLHSAAENRRKARS